MIASIGKSLVRNSISSRTFVTRSVPRCGGDHGHVHPTFGPEPFSKKLVGGIIGSLLVGGTGIVLFSVYHQNKKHGFPVKSD